jgi:hypothetical protein
VDLEPRRPGGDRQVLIAELANDVEGLARRLLECEPQLVLLHRALDLCTHMRCCLEEAIRGHEPIERLMRPLQVVVADEVLEPPLRVDDVREHRPPQELVPQRLPESLDLPERLRMLRATTDVLHAEPREVLFELRLAAPHRVLTTVVRQYLARRAVSGDAALERFHHQR